MLKLFSHLFNIINIPIDQLVYSDLKMLNSSKNYLSIRRKMNQIGIQVFKNQTEVRLT